MGWFKRWKERNPWGFVVHSGAMSSLGTSGSKYTFPDEVTAPYRSPWPPPYKSDPEAFETVTDSVKRADS